MANGGTTPEGTCDALACGESADCLFLMTALSQGAGERITAEYCTVHSAQAIENKGSFEFIRELNP